MSVVKTFMKATVERRRLYIDYSCWLEDDEMLTDLQVTTSPYDASAPINVTTAYTDTSQKKLAMFVSGGVANTTYTLSVVVRTNDGQVKKDDIGLRVTA